MSNRIKLVARRYNKTPKFEVINICEGGRKQVKTFRIAPLPTPNTSVCHSSTDTATKVNVDSQTASNSYEDMEFGNMSTHPINIQKQKRLDAWTKLREPMLIGN